jgi:hypothetical protein
MDTQVELRDERGRMIAPLPGKHTITKADASILARKRWDKYRQEAVKRITGEAQSIDPTVTTGAAAFGLVAAKQYTALMDSDKPAIDQLEKLGRIMTGLTGAEARRDHEPTGEISGSPQALAELVRLLEAERSAAVDQARAIDGTVKLHDTKQGTE